MGIVAPRRQDISFEKACRAACGEIEYMLEFIKTFLM
jgi:hypothetical protein